MDGLVRINSRILPRRDGSKRSLGHGKYVLVLLCLTPSARLEPTQLRRFGGTIAAFFHLSAQAVGNFVHHTPYLASKQG